MNEGMRALDLFTNTGGFAMNMALAGASEVTAIDQSEEALAACRTNAELNEVSEKIRTIHADCFSYLKKTQEKFDCIVLDPPSLVRSKKELKNAEKGYFALHRDAIRSLAPGGLLVTASCSHHFTRELFLDCVRKAASTEKRAAVILEERGAAADHPVHIYMPETEYLKVFYIKIA
jgi:23S rRNA (cytosine1962-C5)-methyltransferase